MPGDYQATMDLSGYEGLQLLSLMLTGHDRRTLRYHAVVAGGRSAETARTGPDHAALAAIADAGGGLCTSDISQIVEATRAGRSRVVEGKRPLWPFCLIAAMLLWPVDLVARKAVDLRV